jgi:glutamate synthase domain-containing protein 2
VDDASGGTVAAPLEFADGVGLPLDPALIFVNKTLVHFGIKDKIRIICSGKIISGSSILGAVARGADICKSALGFKFSLGYIQILRCNTCECPTGVTTQDTMLMKGLVLRINQNAVLIFIKTLYA